MKDFFHYFFGKGETEEFRTFSLTHLIPILLMIGIILLIYFYRDKIRECKHEYVFRWVLAFMMIVAEMSYYWRLVAMADVLDPNPIDHLPIAVCGWVTIFCSYMIVTKSQSLFDISYFWLFSASIFALITPTVITFTGPTRYRFYQFWMEHTLGYIAVFYMIFVDKIRPNVRSIIKSYSLLAVLAVIAYIANDTLGPGANYLYMARPEDTPSILDILPPNYALRVFIMFLAVSVLFFLAYLPWMLKDIKAKKANAG